MRGAELAIILICLGENIWLGALKELDRNVVFSGQSTNSGLSPQHECNYL